MQISHRGPEHNTRVLSRNRHVRLRRAPPRREFRDQFTEPAGLDLVVETVTGCRPIALLAGELDR
jgi:hypothetical protein